MIKELGELSGKIKSLEKEIEDLNKRVRTLEMKIAYYTGIGTSFGVILGSFITKVIG